MLSEISKSFLEFDNYSFDEFLNMCRSTLDQHAPWKQKCARGNHTPFMNKTLSKEITKRTKLPKSLKKRTDDSKKQCASQRNYCISLLKKTNRNYLNTLNEKDVSANKIFWETVKPFLSEKIVSKEHYLAS